MSSQGNERPRLHVFGPLRLLSADGRDCTPKGGFRKALLALLVLSPSGARGRGSLKDMLWDNGSSEQASLGLRNALSLLKRELTAGLGFDPISSDSQNISIDLCRIWVDIRDEANLAQTHAHGPIPQILEGLNLRGAERPDFEDWLRRERAHGEAVIDDLREKHNDKRPQEAEPSMPQPAAPMPVFADPAPLETERDPGGVGLLPSVVVSGGVAATALADAVMDSIATDLSQIGNVRIYDYRDGASGAFGIGQGPGPKLVLRIKVLTDANQFAIQLSILRPQTNQLAGSGSVSGEMSRGQGIDGVVLAGFVGQNVDRILSWLSGPGGDVAPAAPYHALNRMFSFEDGSLDETASLLGKSFDETGDGAALGLLSYLETFRVGEHWGIFGKDVLHRTQDFTDRALNCGPADSLALGASGHAIGYTLHDLETGGDLLHQAVQMSPSVAFVRDHLALNYLYRGDYVTARKAAQDTIQVGAYSPLRFTYDATLCMISTLTGDYSRAVHYGNRALARRPRFGAPLRYTAVSLAHLGRQDEARALVSRIREMDPNFSRAWVEEGRMAILDDDAKARVKKGLELAGV